MIQPAIRQATYEDLLLAPENLVAEILDGELHTHPRPSPRHALSASALGSRLFNPFGTAGGAPGGWWILDEPEVHLGPQILVPDIAGWRRERLPDLPDEAWIELAPDWACEVLSPGTAKIDRTVKMPIYARFGVAHLWLVDPLLRTLEAYALRDGLWSLQTSLKDDDPVRLAPFDEIEFSLSDLWA